MKNLIKGIALVTIGMLTACSGGGGGGGGSGTATGKFVDGPVAGLGYRSGGNTGITGADGSFTYEAGKTVTFFVGSIVLGEAAASGVVTPLHLVPGSNLSTPQVVNIARFLLSVGSVDPATLTITIPAVVTSAANGTSINFAAATETEMLALVQLVTQNPSALLVDEKTAIDHLSHCLYQEYAGTYTGTFTGPAPSNGFEFTISANGEVTGRGINPDNEMITGNLTNGTQFNGVASGGCLLTGTLDVLTGVLSGTWKNADEPASGTFSGKR